MGWGGGGSGVMVTFYLRLNLRHKFQNRCPLGVCCIDGVGLGGGVGTFLGEYIHRVRHELNNGDKVYSVVGG